MTQLLNINSKQSFIHLQLDNCCNLKTLIWNCLMYTVYEIIISEYRM